MKKTIACLLASAAVCAFAGCQQTTAKNPQKKGTYAAARQNRVGSNIPQAYSADSVGATVDNDEFTRAGNQQMASGGRAMGGYGGAGR